MDIEATAARIYEALKCDVSAKGAIKAEYSRLALAIATDPNAAFRLTAATVNGQNFSGQADMTQSERLALLSAVVKRFDNGGQLPRRSILAF